MCQSCQYIAALGEFSVASLVLSCPSLLGFCVSALAAALMAMSYYSLSRQSGVTYQAPAYGGVSRQDPDRNLFSTDTCGRPHLARITGFAFALTRPVYNCI